MYQNHILNFTTYYTYILGWEELFDEEKDKMVVEISWTTSAPRWGARGDGGLIRRRGALR